LTGWGTGSIMANQKKKRNLNRKKKRRSGLGFLIVIK